jgi:uncharacterized protein YigE (DUF2233 family)
MLHHTQSLFYRSFYLYFGKPYMPMRAIFLTTLLLLYHLATIAQLADDHFISYTTTPSTIALYWKDDRGQPLRSLQNLKQYIEKQEKTLAFGMNAGMYRPDSSPQGLFIDNGTIRQPLDTLSGGGNFYMKPNGVFYTTTSRHAGVRTTPRFTPHDTITFATQSGPMLLIDGAIHPAFKKGSANLNIRNGVGILPDGQVLFAMSKEPVNFYDFAQFFLGKGCNNALYLGGFVSRTYLPAQDWKQLDGNFGVMIGVTE